MNEKQFNFIKKYLKLHNFNDICKQNLFDKIKLFQKKNKLQSDGILGPQTLWKLQYEPVISSKKLTFKKLKVDNYKDSYNSFLVRSDVYENLSKIYKKIKYLNAIFPSSGGFRSLNAKVSKGRSATSFHYSGLAIDIYIWSALQDPQNDPLVLVLKGNRFEVYLRTSNEKVRLKTLNVSIIKDKLIKTEVNDRFYSLTNLMKNYGFTGIDIYEKFFRNPKKNYLYSEWWHFQNNTVLVDSLSLFGIELLKVYTEKEIKPVYKYRKSIFTKNGFYYNFKKYLKNN